MATAWRSILRFREPWSLHHPHRCCYYLRLVWLISCLAFLLMEVAGVEVILSSKGCLQSERDALLLYKGAIEDPSARLSSWRAQVDCCAWTGVVCYNTTGSVRVAELNLQNSNVDPKYWTEFDLQNPNDDQLNVSDTALRGELLHPSLLSLSHLQSLNLSFNDFEGTHIPPLVIGSLHKLMYLDLSVSNLGGTIPPHLGNLTNLRHLDLYMSNFGGTTIPPHLGNLINLRHLDLSNSNFGGTIPPHLGNLTNLLHLDLSSYYNSAKVVHSLHWLSGFSSLIYLGMSYLDLSAASHNWIAAVNMVPSLQQLYLYDCKINIPLSLCFHLNLTSLVALDLGRNNFNSSFPNWLWNLTSLSSLQLLNSGIQGTLPTEIGNLIGLTYLDLSYNRLSGPLPNAIWKLKHLLYLGLKYNLLETSLPVGFMNLSSLSTLRLRNCSLRGPIPSELGNLTTLNYISLPHNSLSGPIPFEIWKLVNLNHLDLSFNSFEGEIIEFHHSNLTLPPASLQSLTKLNFLNLGSNRLEGLIPHLPPNLNFLDLSNNTFSGPLPPVCNSYKLERLDISNNQIYGEILRCWQKDSLLEYINLGNNMLFGEIPSSLGNLVRIEYLHLNNNNLKGHLPSSLQNCTRLLVVDLGDNKFSGNIPLWIGQSWYYLGILLLRSNMFDGNIDPQLGNLRDLQIIDFSNNKLSGPIPNSFGNFSTMISTSTMQLPISSWLIFFGANYYFSDSITLVTKGEEFTFSSILYLVKSIDLSNNELTDEIPEELGYLAGLQTLNLSRNYFKGKIPNSIGIMSSLETLDLSYNNLLGIIPQGLSQLNALNHLNLSYNNLSGNIPSGNQLQTLVNKSCFHLWRHSKQELLSWKQHQCDKQGACNVIVNAINLS